MTGLTLDQFKEIVEFAQAYHMFGVYYEPHERAAIHKVYPKWEPLDIKYIDSYYDTRTQRILAVTFQGRFGNRAFDCNKSETILFDRVMAYLKGGEE